MRVLLLNQYYPPDTSATSDLARRLVQLLRAEGIEVTVCAGRPSYRPSASIAFRPWALFARRDGEIRVRSTRFSRESSAGRVANYLTFLLLSLGPLLFGRYDAVVSMTDPPLALLVATPVSLVRRRPIIYWLQDYHPEFLIGVGRLRRSCLVALWSRYHHWCMRRADAVVVIGRDMRDRALNAGVSARRIHLVYNGSAVDTTNSGGVTTDSRSAFRILHAGEIGLRGTWETLVDACRQVRADNIRVVLLGDGVEASRVRELSSDLDNLEIHPPVPASEVDHWLVQADALLVMVRAGSEGYSVPSKTYELLAAGRPIVVLAVESAEPALLVCERDCGVVVDPNDSAALASAFRSLQSDVRLRQRLGENGRLASQDFNRQQCLQPMVRIIRGVATGTASVGPVDNP